VLVRRECCERLFVGALRFSRREARCLCATLSPHGEERSSCFASRTMRLKTIAQEGVSATRANRHPRDRSHSPYIERVSLPPHDATKDAATPPYHPRRPLSAWGKPQNLMQKCITCPKTSPMSLKDGFCRVCSVSTQLGLGKKKPYFESGRALGGAVWDVEVRGTS
jgi:hypothetical protein